MTKISVGSVCSGIEAASVAWKNLNFKFKWFSEIAKFQSLLLAEKFPNTKNIGDMKKIPKKIKNGLVYAPDVICGGTPCQAFSLAGKKKGLADARGNLTLKFVKIIEANDKVRKKLGKNKSVVFWENVEGVLNDKTNAFGCFISALAGYEDAINIKWPQAGIIRGPKRNVAWRILDAKFYGVPQQRKRLYVMAGGKDFYPENSLFEFYKNTETVQEFPLKFRKNEIKIETFRSYTDCLCSSYGTKWNGNAAANNGSLFVAQNKKVRRFTPLECERLMGFPDNYTNILGASNTTRYQSLGNSWAIPVIKHIGKRLLKNLANPSKTKKFKLTYTNPLLQNRLIYHKNKIVGISLNSDKIYTGVHINCSNKPSRVKNSNLKDIVDTDAASNLYISSTGSSGILRRKELRNMNMNKRLEFLLKAMVVKQQA